MQQEQEEEPQVEAEEEAEEEQEKVEKEEKEATRLNHRMRRLMIKVTRHHRFPLTHAWKGDLSERN